MAYTIFSLTGRANPNILAEKLYRQQWKRNTFGLWVAPEFIKLSRDTSDVIAPGIEEAGVKFTGSPIEVFKQFVTQGKTVLDIPVRVRLTDAPVYGDKAVKGTEESGKLIFRTVKINLTRKAYMRPSLISAQITLPYLENLMLEASEYLTQWFNDYHPGNFIQAMCSGYSIDLLNGVTAGGRAIARVSHPNAYVMGVGRITSAYKPGTQGATSYEHDFQVAVDGANSATTNAMTVKRIAALVLEAQRLRIQPITMKAGFRRFAIWMSDAQFHQLRQDQDFKDFYIRLPNQLADSPLATGAVCDLHGAICYVDLNMPHAVTNANYDATLQQPPANQVWFGPQPTASEYNAGYLVGNMVTRRSDQARKVGFLIGASALSVGVGVPVAGGKKGPSMQFVEQFDDYGAIAGIGIATVQSVVRNDIYDQDGVISGNAAGDFQENTSSLLFISNSPDAMTAA